MTKSKLLAAAGLVCALAASGPSDAATLIFDTSDNQFDPGIDNQGWWSGTGFNTDSNDNYFAGTVSASQTTIHSFFTFDLGGGTLAGQTVVGATLRLTRFGSALLNETTETIALFDVSTDAATLNNNTGTSTTIFDDLGTGTSYGSFNVPGAGSPSDVLEFLLNADALADINLAAGGFFSVGAALTSDDGSDVLFGDSEHGGTQQLVLETVATSVPAPEPATLALFGLGLAGLGAARRRMCG